MHLFILTDNIYLFQTGLCISITPQLKITFQNLLNKTVKTRTDLLLPEGTPVTLNCVSNVVMLSISDTTADLRAAVETHSFQLFTGNSICLNFNSL